MNGTGRRTAGRQGRIRPVAGLLPALTRAALRRYGFAEGAAVVASWREIVGPELADHSRPERLAFPKGRKTGAVLHVRVAGALATDFQHLEPLVLARVNSYLGYEAVTGLRIVQGPVAAGLQRPPVTAGRQPPAASQPPDLPDVADADLRAVLQRLAAWVAPHP